MTDGVESPGATYIITSEDVERHVQQNDSIIIDVRNFNEAVEFGKIPTAHVLPGYTIPNLLRVRSDLLEYSDRSVHF